MRRLTSIAMTPPHPCRPAVHSRTLYRVVIAAAMIFLGSEPAASAPTAPERPGTPAPGLQYFRLPPGGEPATFRLLVIPVRFPEHASLGISRGELAELLNGDGPESLRGYYRAATGDRLRIEATLAPTVVADHGRTFYTSEGPGNFGYGTDPKAYPHNARFLVEEVTAKLEDAADFRGADNTGDRIADGLLLVHSGPATGEDPTAIYSPDVLLAHAFTLEEPVLRRDTYVFPYATVASRDPVGPLAHEVGHLLGLPDLYVASGFCPGPGVGEWSLMATGANRSAGTAPTGLDPYSRQLLGIGGRSASGTPVDLSDGTFLRLFRPGESDGPTYFLVERRTGTDGLGLDTPATVIYLVDERVGDNRSCPVPEELYRPLVEVRAVLCPGTASCTVTLDDFTTPGLLDRNGQPTDLSLEIDGASVTARTRRRPAARLARVQLLDPVQPPGEDEQQPIVVTVENLDSQQTTEAVLDLRRLDGGSITASLSLPEWRFLIPPGSVRVDTSWAVIPLVPGSPLPAATARFLFAIGETGSAFVHQDTVTLVTGDPVLDPAAFTPENLAPGRAQPWALDGSEWRVTQLAPLTHAELHTPWFRIPPGGQLLLDHTWDLDALSADVVLDAGRIRVERALAPAGVLAPPLGWGWNALRKTGNALAGQEVLSGAGSRKHIFDLGVYAGEVVRIGFEVAGDIDTGPAVWTLRDLAIRPAASIAFEPVFENGQLLARTDAVTPAPGQLTLYAGTRAVAPAEALRSTAWDGSAAMALAAGTGEFPRFELLWEGADGSVGTAGAILEIPARNPVPGFLAPPSPNPLRTGQTQVWTLALPEGIPAGHFDVSLCDVAGRRVIHREVAIAAGGTRRILWDGRDFGGRPVPAGMYFLQVRRTDGTTESRKIVVLP